MAKALVNGTVVRTISRVSWIEVLAGVQPDNEYETRALLGLFGLYDISPQIAEEAVRLRRQSRLKLPDALIYATAQVHGLTLVTRNTRDFDEAMPGVRIPYIV